MNPLRKKTTKNSFQTTGKATGMAVVGVIATTIANFGVAILVAQVSASFAGIFFVSTAIQSILANATSLGTMTGIVYFMPQTLDEDDQPVNTRPLLVKAISPVVIISCLTGLGVFFSAGWITELLGSESPGDLTAMIKINSIGIPALALSLAFFGATRALGSLNPQVFINQIFKPTAQIILLLIVFLINSKPNPQFVAIAWTAPIVMGLILAIIATYKRGGFSSSGESIKNKIKFWTYTTPRALSVSLQISLERLDVILVSALAGDGPAGIYGGITRFITAGNFLTFSVGQATSPLLRKAIKENDFKGAEHLLKKLTGWMIIITWPYFITLAFKSSTMINLIDYKFLSGATALSVLAIGMAFNSFAGPMDLTLLMLGKSKLSLLGSFLALITDIVLAVILIPRYGLVGAAVAWVAAIVILNTNAYIFVNYHSKLRAYGKSSLIAAAGTALAIIPIALLTPQNFSGLIITGVVSCLFLLFWFRHYSKELYLNAIFNKLDSYILKKKK